MKASKQSWFSELLHTLPLLPRSAVPARRVPRAHAGAHRRVLHARLRPAGAGRCSARPLPGVARVVQLTDALARMFTPQRVPLLRDRGNIRQGGARAGARLCRAPLRRARADASAWRSWCCGRYLYTDTGETWKLADRRKQLVIACAGMRRRAGARGVLDAAWALAPEGGAKSVFFVLASTTWV